MPVLGISVIGFNLFFLQQVMHLQEHHSETLLFAAESWPPWSLQEKFAWDLWNVSQQYPKQPRGLVIPLYDNIAVLGKSLLLELRSLGVDLPVEIPHCGDLSANQQLILMHDDPLIRIYDVCKEAETIHIMRGKLFCDTMDDCHARFRSFDVKLLAVVFSRFQEMMVMDADTIYFHNPMALWENEKYKATGTLFFHDRISQDDMFLSDLMPSHGNLTKFQNFMANFDVEPYRSLPTLARAKISPDSELMVAHKLANFSFEPSEFLLTSHSWNRRAGHEMESSLVLWNKARQPRATAILALFASRFSTQRPPSYGEKELFFIACELAETEYSFSDFGIGSVGWDLRTVEGDPVVCGDVIHFFPLQSGALSTQAAIESRNESDINALAGQPLFTNGENVFKWDLSKHPVYRTKARPASLYPGSFTERGLPQDCPFDVNISALSLEEYSRLRLRHDYIAQSENWLGQSE